MKRTILSTVILLGLLSGLFAAVASADAIKPFNHGANYDTNSAIKPFNHGANYGTQDSAIKPFNHGANY
ncbi:hypothetical protein [Paenibacillus sp. XY044]|uniref:hypothetical protein n=1 Tax=Paenibacillus sp. XY044 TaxID=2026089 RepID=UPI000B98E88E|nr:hypothetical protein [Paenibacillus sp. XY044]OZB95002.1 hypothetical protein CJP46_14950 [Paenibacillus sp. XY044]